MELSTLNLGLGLTISSLVILELCDPYLIPPPQSSDRVRNTLFMQVRNETIQSVQFYSQRIKRIFMMKRWIGGVQGYF